MADAVKPKAVKVTTPKFRVSFPSLDQPRGFEGQEPKFQVTMLFAKDSDMSWLKTKIVEVMTQRFGADKAKWPKGCRNPIRDGDEMETPLKGYEGHYYIKATSKDKPGVVDAKLNEIIDIRNEVYAGCYARATVAVNYYDKAGNKGVAVYLNNLQKLGDGESFGGKRDAKKDFDVAEDEGGAAGDAGGDDLLG